MSNKPPIGVPQGAIRLNTDSQKLEFYAQDRWFEMATDVPTLEGGARGVYGGGDPGSGHTDVIQFLTIPVIASGGVGTLDHFYEGVIKGKADALLAASVFHFNEISIKEVKKYLKDKNISIRD